ncbi:MAG TPA: hypothetical protein VHL52_11340 [Acidimicrobiia bacterium]|nr:hypothetical protein [Acidimicrobiia bacterium]
MMTVITRVQLDAEQAAAWDEAITRRMRTAESVDGWVSGEVLTPRRRPDSARDRRRVGDEGALEGMARGPHI